MRVLVVEDEEFMADAIARGLRKHGMAVDVSLCGGDALYKLDINRYDVVVLDRDLPDLHGDDVCRHVMASELPSRVLMLTAASAVAARVEGLGLGADDYLGKPFAFEELVARVRALGRRSQPARPPVQRRKGIELDVSKGSANRAGRELKLTSRELAVLEILMSSDGALVSAEELLERAWDENADPFTNSVRVIVANLRRKLGAPPIIETFVGGGYRL